MKILIERMASSLPFFKNTKILTYVNILTRLYFDKIFTTEKTLNN